MTSLINKKLNYNSARLWRDALKNATTNTCPVIYVYVGNHTPYANESSPDSIVDTASTEKNVWDNMFVAKRVTGNDVELVIPRINWTSNTKYRQYDDTISVTTLSDTDESANLKPMYVITSGRNVYKCVSNNANSMSTVEPTGDYTTSNGNIGTADGFVWKYMFNVKPSNKFFNSSWIPTPTSVSALDYGVSSTNVVDGELTSVIVTNKGVNYRQSSQIKVDGFTVGQTTLRLSNTANVISIFSIPVLGNLANMSISGTGIPAGTYISEISNTTGVITLSTPASALGGAANNLTISTRVYIAGDGIGAAANAVISNTTSSVSAENANISKIIVDTIGTGYSFANVEIYGSGSGAKARVILPPKFGHGFNPAKELNANNVMVAVRLGDLDSKEGGKVSIDTSFRQFGLLRDPYKYGSSNVITTTTANSVISQTVDLDVVAGFDYALNEYVYQGSSTNPLAYGYLHAQTSNGVRLTKVKGSFVVGFPLIGQTSGRSRTVTAVNTPEFEPYTGDILYIENTTKIDRADGQAENIKLVISF